MTDHDHPSPRRRSPFALLSQRGRRGLTLLILLGVLKAVALMATAESLATGIARIVAGSSDWRDPMLLGIGAAGARAILAWATEVVAARTAIGEKESLRSQLIERILARGGHDLDENQGTLAILATRGLDDLDAYFTRYIPALTGALTIPLLVGLRILIADWVSALIIVVTVPLVPIFMILIGDAAQQRVTDAADSLARLANHLVELARGLPVLIGLGRANDQTEALEAISTSYRQRTMATLKVAFLSALALELIAMISVALVAVFIGVRLNHGSLSLQTGLLVLILAPECYLPFREAGAAFHAAEDGVEALARVRALIARPLSRILPSPSSSDETAIEVRDLTVHYPHRATPALTDLSFTVAPNQIVALSGASGSGKSTILAVLAGLLGSTNHPDREGTTVRGSLSGVDRDRLAWVPQHPRFAAETVRDEVARAEAEGVADETTAILRQLKIDHLAGRYPGELSQGELRRVAFARALARIESGANLLLLDEPTAHLDETSAQVIRAAISALRGRVTIVTATHDPLTLRLADNVIHLGSSTAASPAPVPESNIEPVSAHLEPVAEQVEHSEPASLSLRSTWRSLNRLLGLGWRRTSLILSLGLLATVASVALTATSGWLIVRASERPPILLLLVAIVGVRFFGIARAVFRYLERLVLHDAMLAAATRLRVRVWTALIAQGPAVQRRLQSGSVVDAVIGDIDRLRDLTPRLAFPPLVGLLSAIGATVVLGIILPTTLPIMIVGTLIAMGVAPVLALAADRRAAVAELDLRSNVVKTVTTIIGAAADLRVNGRHQMALDEMNALDQAASAKLRQGALANGLASAIVTASCLVAASAVLAVSASAAEAGRISDEMVAVLALTPLTLVEPLLAISTALRQLPALQSLVQRFAWLEVRHDPHNVPLRDEGYAQPLSALTVIGRIDLDRLSARWPDSAEPVFRDLSTAVAVGEWLTVTGPSGSGKSTLLAVVMGFLRPSAGRYAINGIDTHDLPVSSFNRRIAWCPQNAHLFDSSLRANLLLARPRDRAPSTEEMVATLKRVGLSDLLADLPDGLETRIGSQGANLSGGQRQRVAVARALLTEADLLLIDEPTAHLDRPSALQLIRDLHETLRDRAVIAVTHHRDDITVDDLRLDLC